MASLRCRCGKVFQRPLTHEDMAALGEPHIVLCSDCESASPSLPEIRQMTDERYVPPVDEEHAAIPAEDAEFWVEVARDGQGFVRTQKEWDTLAAYAREMAAKVEELSR